jgi:hypothetical protein
MAKATVALGLVCLGSQAGPARVSGSFGLLARGKNRGALTVGVTWQRPGRLRPAGGGRWLGHHDSVGNDLRRIGVEELTGSSPR